MKNLHTTIQVDVNTKKIMEAIESIKELEREHNLHQVITLLQSLGYTITPPYIPPPYIPPTDEEILARIKAENSKIGYVADWISTDGKYQVTLDTDRGVYRVASRIYTKDIGVIYTTKEIATQIVVELNEKRFERVIK